MKIQAIYNGGSDPHLSIDLDKPTPQDIKSLSQTIETVHAWKMIWIIDGAYYTSWDNVPETDKNLINSVVKSCTYLQRNAQTDKTDDTDEVIPDDSYEFENLDDEDLEIFLNLDGH